MCIALGNCLSYNITDVAKVLQFMPKLTGGTSVLSSKMPAEHRVEISLLIQGDILFHKLFSLFINNLAVTNGTSHEVLD
jgi:hypothetical protein